MTEGFSYYLSFETKRSSACGYTTNHQDHSHVNLSFFITLRFLRPSRFNCSNMISKFTLIFLSWASFCSRAFSVHLYVCGLSIISQKLWKLMEWFLEHRRLRAPTSLSGFIPRPECLHSSPLLVRDNHTFTSMANLLCYKVSLCQKVISVHFKN